MVNKITFIALCILIHNSAAMNNNTKPIPSSPSLEQIYLQHWQELAKTPEFAYCIELLQKNDGSTIKYKQALADLLRTNAGQKYMTLPPLKTNVNS